MDVNKDSSVGITEDLLTNIMHLCASEYHLNILIRKYEDQITFWYNDGMPEFQSAEDLDNIVINEGIIKDCVETLSNITVQRRNAMKLLKSQANENGNKDMCAYLSIC